MLINFIIFNILLNLSIVYGSTGQGIGVNNESDESEAQQIAEAVKQEVYLKTAGAEPIEIGGIKQYNSIGSGARISYNDNSNIGNGLSLNNQHKTQHKVHHKAHHQHSGIGGGAQPQHGHHNDHHSGIGGGAQPQHGHHNEHKHKHNNQGLGDGVVPLSRSYRLRRLSELNRFDSGYTKDCNSYYGRLICYKIYTNPEIRVDPSLTCWRISGGRKNCTEISNINYLREEGFNVYESELPRSRNNRPKQTERITHGESSYYDPYNNNKQYTYQNQYKQNYNGADNYPTVRNSQRGTHKFETNGLNLNEDLGDEVELIRDKRGSRKSNLRNRNQRRNRLLGRQNKQKKLPVF